MSLYSLTHLTGRKRNADRKIIIATVETSKQGFFVSIIAVIISLVPTAVAVMVFGPPAMVVVPPLFIGIALVLFRMQSQKGLRLPIYRALIDKGAAKKTKGRILVCGVPIDTHASVSKLSYSSTPIDTSTGTGDLFGETPEPAPAPVYGAAGAHAEQRTTEPSPIWA